MKHTVLSLTILGAVASAAAQNFTADISKGKIPSTMTTEDRDGHELPSTCYKNGKTSEGWTVSTVGTTGYAFVSPSHSHGEGPQDNRLTAPGLTIEAGACVSWKARSVHPDFPDTYKVVVREGSNETTVYEGTAEEVFSPHAVSLDRFTGKTVDVIFVCNSSDGYLLALSDIFVGVPTEPKVAINESTRRFAGECSEIKIYGTVINTGADTEVSKITLSVNNEVVATEEVEMPLEIGKSNDFEIYLPVNLNEKADYTLAFLDKEGKTLATSTGEAMASWFARTHFVDEGTGMWCNNCPDGTLAIHRFQRQYPGQYAIAVTHNSDMVSNDEYWPGLKFYAVPYMMLNRIGSTQASGIAHFDNGLWKPTPVELTLKKENEKLHVSLLTSEDFDNSDDRYRIGYVMTADYYQTETSGDCYQKNSLTLTNREEYYFLPSLILAHLAKFHYINYDGEGYFEGIAKSVPTTVKAGVKTECVTLTPYVADEEGWSNPRANVYLLDTQTGEILNCAKIRMDGSQDEVISSVETPDETHLFLSILDRTLRLEGARSGLIEIRSVSGTLLYEGRIEGSLLLPESTEGPVVIRAVAPEGTAVIKTIL